MRSHRLIAAIAAAILAADGAGIPPTIRVPVFSAADLEHGRYSAIEKALEILGEPRRQ